MWRGAPPVLTWWSPVVAGATMGGVAVAGVTMGGVVVAGVTMGGVAVSRCSSEPVLTMV